VASKGIAAIPSNQRHRQFRSILAWFFLLGDSKTNAIPIPRINVDRSRPRNG
jgi:hypothetical protein